MYKHFARMFFWSAVVAVLMQSVPTASANWGLEVGRADMSDVMTLGNDWRTFKVARGRIEQIFGDMAAATVTERQRRLIGALGDDVPSYLPQLFEQVQDYWMRELMAPLQRIAMNPAASCAEANFAVIQLTVMVRQQQLLGLDESELFSRVYQVTAGMAGLRCREEALDECVATGRFQQILNMMGSVDRQAQVMGTTDDLESFAQDALKQCAIYELHFVSKTKGGMAGQIAGFGIETVRDGRVPIKLEIPPEGLKSLSGPPLKEILKGETAGGNNPFLVSAKGSIPVGELVCSPGADSTPVKVGINALEMKHKEFYLGYEQNIKNPVGFWESKENEVTKQRTSGNDLFSFVFEGGLFALQCLFKAPYNTVSLPPMQQGNFFYMAHQKDQVGTPPSVALEIKAAEPTISRGIYPVLFRFTYSDQSTFGGFPTTDSTEFELIHKPKPKPFPQRGPQDPSRKPAVPRPGGGS